MPRRDSSATRSSLRKQSNELWVDLWVGIFEPSLRKRFGMMAGSTGLEPAASAVTGQRSNQLNYDPAIGCSGLAETRVNAGDSTLSTSPVSSISTESNRFRCFMDRMDSKENRPNLLGSGTNA